MGGGRTCCTCPQCWDSMVSSGDAELICKGMFSPTPVPALPIPHSHKAGIVSFLSSSSSQVLQSWDSPGPPLGEQLSPLFAMGWKPDSLAHQLERKYSSSPFILQTANKSGMKTDQLNALTLEKDILTGKKRYRKNVLHTHNLQSCRDFRAAALGKVIVKCG